MTDEQQRFEEVWTSHSGAVLRYAARRVSAADVDDVVAETFVVAWRRMDELPDPALPWLLGVARRVAANTTRSANRRAALEVQLAGSASASAAIEAPSTTGVAGMLEALDRLSPADRELLTLIAWDGLTPAEAATTLGCSRAALAVRLHRARTRLRSHLAATSAGPRPDGTPSGTDTRDPSSTPLVGENGEVRR